MRGDANICELLIEYGAFVGARDQRGCTPLHVCRSIAVAELLLRHGADPTARNNAAQTPYGYLMAMHSQNDMLLDFLKNQQVMNRSASRSRRHRHKLLFMYLVVLAVLTLMLCLRLFTSGSFIDNIGHFIPF